MPKCKPWKSPSHNDLSTETSKRREKKSTVKFRPIATHSENNTLTENSFKFQKISVEPQQTKEWPMSKLDEVVKGFVIYKCSKLKKSIGHESRGWGKENIEAQEQNIPAKNNSLKLVEPNIVTRPESNFFLAIRKSAPKWMSDILHIRKSYRL